MALQRLYFVRHGETDWNRARRLQGRCDVPLNATGLQQARELARHVIPLGVGKVVSSPLQRAAQTAEIIAATLGTGAVAYYGNLVERDYGEAAGLSAEERAERFTAERPPHGQETLAALRERALKAFEEIRHRESTPAVLVVAHSGLINSLIAHFTNETHGTGKTRLGNCSVTGFILQQGAWVLAQMNHCPLGRSASEIAE